MTSIRNAAVINMGVDLLYNLRSGSGSVTLDYHNTVLDFTLRQ